MREFSLHPISPEIFFSKEFQSLPTEEHRQLMEKYNMLGKGYKKIGRVKRREDEVRKTSRRYWRLFRNKTNAAIAKELITDGVSYSRIAKFFGCDHTSVMAFKERCEKVGIVFPEGVKLSSEESNIRVNIFSVAVADGVNVNDITVQKKPVSEKKTTYVYNDYLKKYKEDNKDTVKERMAKAKETIANLHKWRKENNIIDYDNFEV